MASSILQRRDVVDLSVVKERHEFRIEPFTDCEPPEYAVRLYQNGQDGGFWMNNGVLVSNRSPNLLRQYVIWIFQLMGREIAERIEGVTG